VWRVFWVPPDAVRAGVRRRVLPGWEDLSAREEAVGTRAGDPIFLAPDYRVDPLLGLYAQSQVFRRYTAETRRNYATDIALLLTFLWARGKSWTDAVERDLEDYEHWRRFARENPARVGGAKWDRELAAFTSLYRWAARPENGHVARNPVAMRLVRGRSGDMVTVAAARAKDARRSNVLWLTRGRGAGGPTSACAATVVTESRKRGGAGGWKTATWRSPGCWSARACAGRRAGRC
jgi:hypothetical protein